MLSKQHFNAVRALVYCVLAVTILSLNEQFILALKLLYFVKSYLLICVKQIASMNVMLCNINKFNLVEYVFKVLIVLTKFTIISNVFCAKIIKSARFTHFIDCKECLASVNTLSNTEFNRGASITCCKCNNSI